MSSIPFKLLVFLLPDWIRVDVVIEPQDVKAEKSDNHSVDSGHEPMDEMTSQYFGDRQSTTVILSDVWPMQW